MALRVELGLRELQQGTATVSSHPAYQQLLQPLMQDLKEMLKSSQPQETTVLQSSQQQPQAAPRGRFKLCDVPQSQLTDVCTKLLATVSAASQCGKQDEEPVSVNRTSDYQRTSVFGTEASYWGCSSLDAADLLFQEQLKGGPQLPVSSTLCTKLHCWPHANAPRAVWAALDSASSCRNTGGAASTSGCPQTLDTSNAVEGSATSQPPLLCVDHIKHLAGMCPPCHCGCGHVTLSKLMSDVSSCYTQMTGRVVTEWVNAGNSSKGGNGKAGSAIDKRKPKTGSRKAPSQAAALEGDGGDNCAEPSQHVGEQEPEGIISAATSDAAVAAATGLGSGQQAADDALMQGAEQWHSDSEAVQACGSVPLFVCGFPPALSTGVVHAALTRALLPLSPNSQGVFAGTNATLVPR